jgi:hypothetical protein
MSSSTERRFLKARGLFVLLQQCAKLRFLKSEGEPTSGRRALDGVRINTNNPEAQRFTIKSLQRCFRFVKTWCILSSSEL